jgi:hypothetical protein
MSRPVPNGPLAVGVETVIGEHCVFGYPKEARLRSPGLGAAKPVMIGD